MEHKKLIIRLQELLEGVDDPEINTKREVNRLIDYVEFKPYLEIDNSYQAQLIDYQTIKYPEYAACKYSISHKLDGASIQLKFTKQKDTWACKYGARTRPIYPDESFGGFWGCIDRLSSDGFFAAVDTCFESSEIGTTVTFYGELFGKKIQNRIDYGFGESSNIRFFDISINNRYQTQKEFWMYMANITSVSDLDLTALCVPTIAQTYSLEEAMSLDVENLACNYNSDGDIEEGIVIKPWDIIAEDGSGAQHMFFLKKKSCKFAEVMKGKPKAQKVIPEDIASAQDLFKDYLTENRMLSVFSKEGKIEMIKDMGKYVKLFSQDAVKEFMKDHGELIEAIDNNKIRFVFSSAGKEGAKILKKYLQ